MSEELWKGLPKLVEETGELQQVLGKLAAFPVGEHPDKKINLPAKIEEELGHVLAAIEYFMTANKIAHEAVAYHMGTKMTAYNKWDLSGIKT